MKSLQNKYNLIKEGKGNKELFIKEARTMFPSIVTGALTFNQAIHNLTERGIISEGITGVLVQRENEPNWFQIFNENTEKVKSDLKKTDKSVEEKEIAGYDYEDKSNNNNISTAEILKGYYAEMKDPKNADKTEEELKKIVFKNLEKDPLHYVKDGAFGIKGIGYTEDAPGLGKTKEVTGKYKSSGMEPVKLSESKHSDEADLKIYKSELNMLNKTKPTGEKQLKRKAELEKKIADLEKKVTEVFYGSSDGDYEADQENEQMAYYNYDKGLEAYSEGDFLKADRYYTTALRYGSYLGWTEQDLPPYSTKMTEGESIYVSSDNHFKVKHNGKTWDVEYHNHEEGDSITLSSGNEKIKGKVTKVTPNGDITISLKEENMNTLTEAKKRAIEKHLKEIEKLGEVAAYGYKANKVQEKIEELKNKLAVTESDDMKEMVDKNTVKEIKKDIALLEKKKKMYEAQKAKAAKRATGHQAPAGDGPRPTATDGAEVIDEAKEKKPMWEKAMKNVLKKKGY